MATADSGRIVHDEDNDPSRMTFTAHLGELRTRLLRSVAAILIGFVVCYIVSNQLITLLSQPLMPLQSGGEEAITEDAQPPQEGTVYDSGVKWIVLNPIEPVLVKLKISAYGGMLLALPFIIWQVCAFVFPGLHGQEKRAVKILLFGCTLLAVAGVALAYWIVLPVVLTYVMEAFLPEHVFIQLRLNETLSIVIKLLFGFAIAFQLPMVVMILVYVDLLTPETLREHRKTAIVGLFCASALLTPPDPQTLLLLAIPMVGLYEASIWMSYLVRRRREAAEAV